MNLFTEKKTDVKRYEQALNFLKDKYQDGTNSREDTIYAMHGLAMDVSKDTDIRQSDAFIIIDMITDSIENIGISPDEKSIVMSDSFSRLAKCIMT